MKLVFGSFSPLVIALAGLNLAGASVPVTFTLAVDPAGVAIQFDVTSSSSLDSIGLPEFEGASDHFVRSATIASGAHRFVVYSVTGEPISSAGEVSVTFESSLAMADGAISIENVFASNSLGVVVTAEAPNALPVLRLRSVARRSVEIGNLLEFSSPVVDLDGAITTASLLSNVQEVDVATAAPYALDYGPTTSGTYALSLIATDNNGQSVTYDLGILRAYELSEITDYDSFATIHFGSGTSDSDFDADPLGNGFANGLAFLHGVNPHSADNSRLPKVAMERVGDGLELVLTFVRRSDLAGVVWKVRESSGLATFSDLAGSAVTDTDKGDGTHEVEVRIPLGVGNSAASFVTLQVSQP